ncbi:MAG: hypothetical protein MHPSP_002112, partial [Paramarteilia canceri]
IRNGMLSQTTTKRIANYSILASLPLIGPIFDIRNKNKISFLSVDNLRGLVYSIEENDNLSIYSLGQKNDQFSNFQHQDLGTYVAIKIYDQDTLKSTQICLCLVTSSGLRVYFKNQCESSNMKISFNHARFPPIYKNFEQFFVKRALGLKNSWVFFMQSAQSDKQNRSGIVIVNDSIFNPHSGYCELHQCSVVELPFGKSLSQIWVSLFTGQEDRSASILCNS